MDDAKEQAKEQFARLRGSMQPRVDSVQSRLRQVPDRLQNIPDQLQKLPERIPRNFPRPSSPRGHGRSNSWGSSGGRSPSPPRESLIAPPLLRAPALSDPTYDSSLATLASKILYRSGECPVSGGPLMVLCASAFPDANVIDYTVLLPYVLSNLPGDDELNGSVDGGSAGGYSVVFFAGGGDKKSEQGGRPTWKWTLQAYTLVGVFREIARQLDEDKQLSMTNGGAQLGRAVRKKIQRLWVVHEKSWIRTILEIMAGVVSVKFKKKIVHLATLSDLAIHVDITKLNIPPSVYLYDRKLSNKIVVPGFPPEPVFGREPFRVSANPPRVGDNTPLPQVLVDTSTYIRQSCLHVQGLFRVPPSQALLECARDCYDRKTSLVWDNWGPHIAAGLIKLYYRSLPRPMIPMEHYEQMQSLVATDPDPTRRPTEEEEKEVRFEVVRSLLTAETAGLPEYSRILFLRHLLPLLADISVHSAENKMDSTNLAVCVAGSLARSDDVAADARASAGIRKFVEIGIERIEELAPKLPLRRGLADAGHRRSQVSLVSLESGGPARQPIARKLVPSLTMPRWENQGKETAIQRKPLPSYFDGATQSPVQMSPVDISPRSFSDRETRWQNVPQSVPQGPRPPPLSSRNDRASTYDGPTSPHPVRTSSLSPMLPPADMTSLDNNPPPSPHPVRASSLINPVVPVQPPQQFFPEKKPSPSYPEKKPTPSYPEKKPIPSPPEQKLPPPTRPRTRSEYTPYHPPVLPSAASLRPTTSAGQVQFLAPGTFARPTLRRVASANFQPAVEPAEKKTPVIRRAKSQLIGSSSRGTAATGVPVRELKKLWEEKAKEDAAAAAAGVPVLGRRYSSVSMHMAEKR